METRHLTYFKTLAEALHFGKAAGKYFLTRVNDIGKNIGPNWRSIPAADTLPCPRSYNTYQKH